MLNKTVLGRLLNGVAVGVGSVCGYIRWEASGLYEMIGAVDDKVGAVTRDVQGLKETMARIDGQ